MQGEWEYKVLNVTNEGFEKLALELFHFQYKENPVYRAFVNALGLKPDNIKSIEQIPFLPISFFKNKEIKSTDFIANMIFESSGTTGSTHSKHSIKNIEWYTDVFKTIFEMFYGPIQDWCIIGLLPSYLERNNSSLVFMVNSLIEKSNHPKSGFYLNEYEQLFKMLNEVETKQQKTLLIGVTFALLDFAEKYSITLNNTVLMETGGMKGRRQEMIRDNVHSILKKAFGVAVIHSEYGMTELLSQAYSYGNGIYKSPPWMKVLIRDDEDPFLIMKSGNGVINVIDLANIYSCCFIATDDIGKLNEDGSFEVLGRLDETDLRGCSLLTI
jgi:phenylacetate-coenzyme A ligase PaaK-like adenylate-forming protein